MSRRTRAPRGRNGVEEPDDQNKKSNFESERGKRRKGDKAENSKEEEGSR